MKNEDKKTYSNSSCGSKKGGGLFMGGALIVFGGVFLAEHVGYLQGISAWQLWPLALVWGGIVKLFSRKCGATIGGGLIFIAIGGALLAHNMGAFDLRWSLIWPVLLILFGLIIFIATLRTTGGRKKKNGEVPIVNNTFETSLIMAGREDEIHSKEFESGYVSVIMGGLELDMRNAELKGEEAVLNLKLVMGGVELWVPQHWEIISKCSPVMGGIENKTRRHSIDDDSSPKRLIIDGSIVMGGIEIRN